ncbi:putative bifunctional diguanylate cyclase/phosphodiesterase [Geopseudomonas aromaticivorans]
MHLSQLLGPFALLATLLLALGSLLGLLRRRQARRRLAALGAVADAFAAGNSLTRADATDNDAIGQLAQRFNHMIAQLEGERRALRDSEQLLRSLIEAAPVGMLVLDQQGNIDSANPAAAQIFGSSPEQLRSHRAGDLLIGQDAWSRLLEQPNRSLEFAARRDRGSFALEASCTPFLRDGQPLQLLLVRDIDDRKLAENRLHYLAHYDPLTGIANRTQLLARLELGLQCGAAQALLFIDLDHFKRINDTLGHDIGDLLLRGVAERLRKHAPPGALLARLGGDEFIVLLSGGQVEQADSLAEQLLQSFRLPFHVRQYELFTSPSIGITRQQGGHTSATQLLKEADLALYHAKSRGRNRLAHFDHQLADDAEQRRRLEEELRAALLRHEFELYYQPQIDRDGQAHTFEALLRWHSPSRGLVNSALFMPVLEETGLIIEATRWVFRQACRQLRHWQDEGRDWNIAVNLSPLDFRQGDLAGTLLAIIAEEQPPVQRLELEITETTLLDADQQIIDSLLALKRAGLTLFLDDFGTGYASLTYLQHFPFDGVKIDRQFVAGLPDSRESVALVRGILVIAEQLGMQVVAEGVANQRQADFLRAHHCQRLQGYLFGRPQSASACSRLQACAECT